MSDRKPPEELLNELGYYVCSKRSTDHDHYVEQNIFIRHNEEMPWGLQIWYSWNKANPLTIQGHDFRELTPHSVVHVEPIDYFAGLELERLNTRNQDVLQTLAQDHDVSIFELKAQLAYAQAKAMVKEKAKVME